MLGNKIIVDFLLWFKRKHYRNILFDGYPVVQVYKNLFGQKYIFGLYEKPPEHFNCRCVSVEELEIKLAEAQQWIDSEPDWKDQYMKRYMALQNLVKELETKLRTMCPHLKTRSGPWPDGGAIDICIDCGMSRYIWEHGKSSWQWIEDIPKARKELEGALLLAGAVNKQPFIPGGKI